MPKKPDCEGLETLAAHLYQTPRRGFRMGSWSSLIRGRFIDRNHLKNSYKCGMAACLGGHAALIFPGRLQISELSGCLYHPETDACGYEAFAEAFNLSWDDAFELCRPTAAHQGPRQAAAAIRALITELKGN